MTAFLYLFRVFESYLAQMYIFPNGKAVVIGQTGEIKINLFLFLFIFFIFCFFSSFVKLSFHVCCVLHFSSLELLGLSCPEGLSRADVGTGRIKL